MQKNKIAIFASGAGTNANKICEYFQDHPRIQVELILSNKEFPGVKNVAELHGVTFKYFNNTTFAEGTEVLEALANFKVDYIVLAGFLRKIPEILITKFQDRIFNIHPSLLPKYGGKGMFGHHVHEAVIKAGETHSGITIHLVNREYDKGRILFQQQCLVEKSDTTDTLANKIHLLEHQHFPAIIERFITLHTIERSTD